MLLPQISRAIGDAYLKRAEFNREPLLARFRLPEPFNKPILKAEPTILVQKLYPEDQFLIFASDGLWEHLSNQEAVDFVRSCPRNVGLLFMISTFFCLHVTLLLFMAVCNQIQGTMTSRTCKITLSSACEETLTCPCFCRVLQGNFSKLHFVKPQRKEK